MRVEVPVRRWGLLSDVLKGGGEEWRLKNDDPRVILRGRDRDISGEWVGATTS